MKIVNRETGKLCGPNEVGEIWTNTDTMMLGYINASTDGLLDEDGFFKMGDLGYYDKTGVLYYSDRLKDVIKHGLHDVYPAEVEKVIEEHPEVVAVSHLEILNFKNI